MNLSTHFTLKLRGMILIMLLPLLFLNTANAQSSRMFPANEDFESGTFPPTG